MIQPFYLTSSRNANLMPQKIMQRPTTLHKPGSNPEQRATLMSEATLRKELRRVRATRRSAPREDSKGHHLWLIGLCIFTLSGLFYRFWPQQDLPTMAVIEMEQAPIERANFAAAATPRLTPSSNTTNSTPPTVQAKPKVVEITPCPTEEPLPMAYEPNIYLEQLAGSMNCSAGVVQTVSPAPDTFYAVRNCVVQIPFEGTVCGAQESLNLSVYSNQPEHYKQDRPIFEEPLLLEKTGKNQRYALKAMLNLPPGLYYFVIENKAEKTVAVGKFKVG